MCSSDLHVVRQRFLRVAMLAHFHRHRGGSGVSVVGSGDGAGVDAAAHLVEHHAEVGETLGFGVRIEHARAAAFVHVAQCDDVATGVEIRRASCRERV